MERSNVYVKVPHESMAVTTPLKVENWASLLATHPNQELVQFFISGISEGFRIGFKPPPKPLKSARRNQVRALQHPDTVSQYLADEISHNRVAGPFKSLLSLGLTSAGLGSSPKTISKTSGT